MCVPFLHQEFCCKKIGLQKPQFSCKKTNSSGVKMKNIKFWNRETFWCKKLVLKNAKILVKKMQKFGVKKGCKKWCKKLV